MSASTHQCAGIVRKSGLRCVSRAKCQHFGCEDDWYCVVHYRSTLEKERPKKDPPAPAPAPAVVEPKEEKKEHAPDVKNTGKFFKLLYRQLHEIRGAKIVRITDADRPQGEDVAREEMIHVLSRFNVVQTKQMCSRRRTDAQL